MTRQSIGTLLFFGMFAGGWAFFALVAWYANRDLIREERRRREARKKPGPTGEELREAFRREREGERTGDRFAGVRYLETRPSLKWTADDFRRERQREKEEERANLLEYELECGRQGIPPDNEDPTEHKMQTELRFTSGEVQLLLAALNRYRGDLADEDRLGDMREKLLRATFEEVYP